MIKLVKLNPVLVVGSNWYDQYINFTFYLIWCSNKILLYLD